MTSKNPKREAIGQRKRMVMEIGQHQRIMRKKLQFAITLRKLDAIMVSLVSSPTVGLQNVPTGTQ